MKRIELTRNKVALVDDDDFEHVNAIKWYCTSNGYAAHKNGRKYVLMHRFIMGVEKLDEIDHINRDKLDNRKNNLRIAPRRINLLNRKRSGGSRKSKYPKGVYKQAVACKKPYYVRITIDYKQRYFGSFATLKEATTVANNAYGGTL